MCLQYISNPNAIILAVTAANQVSPCSPSTWSFTRHRTW